MDVDSGDDWSTSMATPTCLQLPVRSTPVITTTDEETSGWMPTPISSLDVHVYTMADHDRSLPTSEGVPVTSQLANEVPVARVLFSGKDEVQPPHSLAAEGPLRHRNGVKRLHRRRFDLSPISASPLLSSQHQQQTPPSSEAHHRDTSVSLISTHTIADTPTRSHQRSECCSVRLNKVFCDESDHQVTCSDHQVTCSQELFGSSPEVSRERDYTVCPVSSVPDSPLLQTPHSLPDGNEQTSPTLEEVPPSPTSHVGEATEDVPAADGDISEEKHINLSTNPPATSSQPLTVMDTSTTCETFLTVQQESLSKRRCTTNQFLYPSSRRPSNRPHQAVHESSRTCLDEKGVECSVQSLARPPWLRGRRKRNASTSAAPPEKKMLQNSNRDGGIIGPGSQEQTLSMDSNRPEKSSHSPACNQQGYGLTSGESVAATEESTGAQPVGGVGGSHGPAPHSSFLSNQSSQLPVTEDSEKPEQVPMECSCPSSPPPRPPVGFTTASGHSISISAHGIKKARELMAEDEVHPVVINRKEVTEPAVVTIPDTNKSVAASFTGFQTASGHSFSISEKALEKARQFLSEDDEDQHRTLLTSKRRTQSVSRPFLPSVPQSVPTSTKTVPRTPSSTLPPRSTLSTGRLRARGAHQTRPFKAPRPASSVSKEEESAKISRLLHGMRRAGAGSDYVPPGREVATTPRVEFSTGSGKKLSISAASYQRAQQLVNEDKENGIATSDLSTTPLNRGFKSASGKVMAVSTKAMERAHTLFAGIDENKSLVAPTPMVPEPDIDVHTPGPSAVHDDQCFYTGGELGREDIAEFAAFTQVQFQDTGGMSQATDEGSTLSPSPVVRDKKGWEEDKDGENGREEMEQEGDHSEYFSTQVVKQFLDFSEDDEDTEQLVTSTSLKNPTLPSSEGQPAIQPHREKGEVVCHTAPAGRESTSDNCCDDSSNVAKETLSSFCQQTTTSSLIDELFGLGDSESCSVEVKSAFREEPFAVSTSQRVTEIEAKNQVEFLEQVVSEGESSGDVTVCRSGESGATVEEEAEIHREQPEASNPLTIGKDTTEEAVLSSVAIANDNSVENGLKTVDQIHTQQDTTGTPVDTSERATLPFSGLMTASGKKIAVSDTALSAARAALHTSPPSTPIRAQLQTASGRAVSISEESLKAVKCVLNTIPSSSSESQLTIHTAANETGIFQETLTQTCKIPSPFPGLQTASGRAVKVSEAALKAVREADSTTSGCSPGEDSPAVQQAAGEGQPSAEEVAGLPYTSTAAHIPSTGTDVRASSSADGVAPRITPHFRPLAMHKALPSSKSTVRYKPVFKRGHQTHRVSPSPSPAYPTPSLPVRQQGLHSSPIG